MTEGICWSGGHDEPPRTEHDAPFDAGTGGPRDPEAEITEAALRERARKVTARVSEVMLAGHARPEKIANAILEATRSRAAMDKTETYASLPPDVFLKCLGRMDCHHRLKDGRTEHGRECEHRIAGSLLSAVTGDLFLDPRAAAAVSELHSRVMEAFRTLDQRQQSVVSLREMHGLSFAEIGNLLGITVVWARVAHHRALEAIRDVVCREGPQGGWEPL